MNKAVKQYNLDGYYEQAVDLVTSGRARNAFLLDQETPETRDKYGRHTFGQSLYWPADWWKPGRESWKSCGPRSPIRTIIRGTSTPGFPSG